ncbi:unnamed protein product [Peniophora sp. CBMAI 1063]|nr:unnamed protein product [Peniophora sp. CBMAI 1063]
MRRSTRSRPVPLAQLDDLVASVENSAQAVPYHPGANPFAVLEDGVPGPVELEVLPHVAPPQEDFPEMPASPAGGSAKLVKFSLADLSPTAQAKWTKHRRDSSRSPTPKSTRKATPFRVISAPSADVFKDDPFSPKVQGPIPAHDDEALAADLVRPSPTKQAPTVEPRPPKRGIETITPDTPNPRAAKGKQPLYPRTPKRYRPDEEDDNDVYEDDRESEYGPPFILVYPGDAAYPGVWARDTDEPVSMDSDQYGDWLDYHPEVGPPTNDMVDFDRARAAQVHHYRSVAGFPPPPNPDDPYQSDAEEVPYVEVPKHFFTWVRRGDPAWPGIWAPKGADAIRLDPDDYEFWPRFNERLKTEPLLRPPHHRRRIRVEDVRLITNPDDAWNMKFDKAAPKTPPRPPQQAPQPQGFATFAEVLRAAASAEANAHEVDPTATTQAPVTPPLEQPRPFAFTHRPPPFPSTAGPSTNHRAQPQPAHTVEPLDRPDVEMRSDSPPLPPPPPPPPPPATPPAPVPPAPVPPAPNAQAPTAAAPPAGDLPLTFTFQPLPPPHTLGSTAAPAAIVDWQFLWPTVDDPILGDGRARADPLNPMRGLTPDMQSVAWELGSNHTAMFVSILGLGVSNTAATNSAFDRIRIPLRLAYNSPNLEIASPQRLYNAPIRVSHAAILHGLTKPEHDAILALGTYLRFNDNGTRRIIILEPIIPSADRPTLLGLFQHFSVNPRDNIVALFNLFGARTQASPAFQALPLQVRNRLVSTFRINVDDTLGPGGHLTPTVQVYGVLPMDDLALTTTFLTAWRAINFSDTLIGAATLIEAHCGQCYSQDHPSGRCRAAPLVSDEPPPANGPPPPPAPPPAPAPAMQPITTNNPFANINNRGNGRGRGGNRGGRGRGGASRGRGH